MAFAEEAGERASSVPLLHDVRRQEALDPLTLLAPHLQVVGEEETEVVTVDLERHPLPLLRGSGLRRLG